MTKAILIALILMVGQTLYAREHIDTVSPREVRLITLKGFPKLDPEEWIRRGSLNFVNLSFWGSKGPVGRLVISGEEKGRGKPEWPVISLDSTPRLLERGEAALTAFSGSHLLIKDSIPIKPPKSFFARRNCPRTGVGILHNGDLVIIVMERATLSQLSRRLLELGAVNAINLDGGGSSLFVRKGEILWPQGDRRGVPVILAWKR